MRRAAPRPRTAALVVVVAAGLALPGPVATPATAQQGDPVSAPPYPQEATDLTRLLDTLAVLWTRGDAAALASHSADAGLDLEVQGEIMGPLQGRRAAAALRQLFGAQETVAVRTGSAARISGVEDRAFGEFVWVVRMPGAAVTEDARIFMALVREDRRWRVSQIRILP